MNDDNQYPVMVSPKEESGAAAMGIEYDEPKRVKNMQFLLDNSGSMATDVKTLEQALKDTLPTVKAWQDDPSRNIEIRVQIMLFNTDVEYLVGSFGEFVKLDDIKAIGEIKSMGGTNMGQAIEEGAASLQASQQPGVKYSTPAVILMSDGAPTDCTKLPLSVYETHPMSRKCSRISVAFGSYADKKLLATFLSNDMLEMGVFEAKDASELAKQLRDATVSVVAGHNPNAAQSLVGNG